MVIVAYIEIIFIYVLCRKAQPPGMDAKYEAGYL